MQEVHVFLPLMVVVGLALAVPIALSRFKRIQLPIVVGEILAGMVIGRSGLRVITEEDALLRLLSELGFVFLMFLAGTEVDLTALPLAGARRTQGPRESRGRWGPFTIGLLSFGITLGLSSVMGFTFWRLGMVRDPYMMALILSTTSLGVVVPVLKERGLSSGRLGQTILFAALIADFATMGLITIRVAMLSHGVAGKVLFFGVLIGAVFLVSHFGIVMNRIKAVQEVLEQLSHATAQIKVRAAFAVMLMFVALSEALGTEVILGAFMAGAVIGMLGAPKDERLLHQLEGIGYGFFIPIFFIMVGVNFNMPALFASRDALLILPLLLGVAVIVKMASAVLFRLAFSWRETVAAGILLSARLSLIIAAVAIGSRLGLISEIINSAIVLVAVVTVTAAPALFLRLMPGRPPAAGRPIIVAGAGQLGLQVAEQLRRHRERVVVVDSDPSRIERAGRLGFEAVTAHADSYDLALAPHLDQAQALVCTHTDTARALPICQFARTHYGVEKTIAYVTNPADAHLFQKLGVITMSPGLDRAAILTLLTRNPGFYALLSGADGDQEVMEVVVSNVDLVGRALRRIKLPGDVLILALRRSGDSLIPHGDTRLEKDDLLTLGGTFEAVLAAQQMFEQPDRKSALRRGYAPE